MPRKKNKHKFTFFGLYPEPADVDEHEPLSLRRQRLGLKASAENFHI